MKNGEKRFVNEKKLTKIKKKWYDEESRKREQNERKRGEKCLKSANISFME